MYIFPNISSSGLIVDSTVTNNRLSGILLSEIPDSLGWSTNLYIDAFTFSIKVHFTGGAEHGLFLISENCGQYIYPDITLVRNSSVLRVDDLAGRKKPLRTVES